MKNQVLVDLEKSLEAYRFFWNEWAADVNCNLSSRQIELVNAYLNNTYEIGFLDNFLFRNKTRAVKEVTRKLDLGYQIFKDFVIVQFLFSVIRMAKSQGYNEFLSKPVLLLNISPDLKDILVSFKAYSLQQLFIIYKVEDFGRGSVYKRIVDFHIQLKKEELVEQSLPV